MFERHEDTLKLPKELLKKNRVWHYVVDVIQSRIEAICQHFPAAMLAVFGARTENFEVAGLGAD